MVRVGGEVFLYERERRFGLVGEQRDDAAEKPAAGLRRPRGTALLRRC